MNAQSPIFIDEEKEMMYGCGLDHNKYELSAWILPRWIGDDLDGDDAHDDIAPIIRKRDGRKGIAICRASTWVSIIGYTEDAQIPLESKDCELCDKPYLSLAQYLDATEVWQVQKTKMGRDNLILGRIEKAELAIHWNGEKFTHELLWAIVEP